MKKVILNFFFPMALTIFFLCFFPNSSIVNAGCFCAGRYCYKECTWCSGYPTNQYASVTTSGGSHGSCTDSSMCKYGNVEGGIPAGCTATSWSVDIPCGNCSEGYFDNSLFDFNISSSFCLNYNPCEGSSGSTCNGTGDNAACMAKGGCPSGQVCTADGSNNCYCYVIPNFYNIYNLVWIDDDDNGSCYQARPLCSPGDLLGYTPGNNCGTGTDTIIGINFQTYKGGVLFDSTSSSTCKTINGTNYPVYYVKGNGSTDIFVNVPSGYTLIYYYSNAYDDPAYDYGQRGCVHVTGYPNNELHCDAPNDAAYILRALLRKEAIPTPTPTQMPTPTPSPSFDKQLHIRGSVVANRFILQRNLGSSETGEVNDLYPAELFEYGTEQIFAFPAFLRFRPTLWSEVNP